MTFTDPNRAVTAIRRKAAVDFALTDAGDVLSAETLDREEIWIQNHSLVEDVFLGIGEAAVAGAGLVIRADTTWIQDSPGCTTQAIDAIMAAGKTADVTVSEA